MSDGSPLSEAEQGLLAAVKALVEFLVANNVSTPQAIQATFVQQRDGFDQLGMPIAAYVLDALQEFAGDPARATARARLLALLAEPPDGPAGEQ